MNIFRILAPSTPVDAFANERAAYARDVAELNKRLSDRNVELIRERAAKHTIGAALAEALNECDALQAKLDRMTGGQRQNRKREAV